MRDEVHDVGVFFGARTGILVGEDRFGYEGVGGYDVPVPWGFGFEVYFPPRLGEGLRGGFAVHEYLVGGHLTRVRKKSKRAGWSAYNKGAARDEVQNRYRSAAMKGKYSR